MLHAHRTHGFTVKARMLHDHKQVVAQSEFRDIVASDPFGFLAYTEMGEFEEISDYFDTLWYSTFQHRMIVLVGALNLYHRSLDPSCQSLPLDCARPFSWTLEQVKKFVSDDVRRSHPEAAKTILERYLPAVLEEVGSEIKLVQNLRDDMSC
ncbi:hypothetical protein JCM5353_008750 [Sporobolomyces roseus]